MKKILSKIGGFFSELRRFLRKAGLTAGRITSLIALMLVFSGLFYVYWAIGIYQPTLADPNVIHPALNNPSGSGSEGGSDINPDLPPRKEGHFTFLIMGIDTEANAADSIMYIALDVNDGQISVLHIPRDTYICTDSAYKRINAVYTFAERRGRTGARTSPESIDAGARALRDKVQETFGLIVDYYFAMNLRGFREIVDLVNGVEVNVPINMRYSDPYQNPPIHINLNAGVQILDGRRAEQFIRFREHPRGDIFRMENQAAFLTALFRRVMERPADIPRVAQEGMNHVTTNMTLNDMIFFSMRIAEMPPEAIDNIIFRTIPTRSWRPFPGGPAYERITSRNAVMEMLEEYFNPYNFPIPIEWTNMITAAA